MNTPMWYVYRAGWCIFQTPSKANAERFVRRRLSGQDQRKHKRVSWVIGRAR